MNYFKSNSSIYSRFAIALKITFFILIVASSVMTLSHSLFSLSLYYLVELFSLVFLASLQDKSSSIKHLNYRKVILFSNILIILLSLMMFVFSIYSLEYSHGIYAAKVLNFCIIGLFMNGIFILLMRKKKFKNSKIYIQSFIKDLWIWLFLFILFYLTIFLFLPPHLDFILGILINLYVIYRAIHLILKSRRL